MGVDVGDTIHFCVAEAVVRLQKERPEFASHVFAIVQYEVDGLSGATITSKGVSNLIHYWLGPDAFGPFLDLLHQRKDATPNA